MAEGENDWLIEDSEEEDQLGSSQLNDHRSTSPLLPGAHLPGWDWPHASDVTHPHVPIRGCSL